MGTGTKIEERDLGRIIDKRRVKEASVEETRKDSGNREAAGTGEEG